MLRDFAEFVQILEICYYRGAVSILKFFRRNMKKKFTRLNNQWQRRSNYIKNMPPRLVHRRQIFCRKDC